MPKSAYRRIKTKNGFRYMRGNRFITEAQYRRGKGLKSKARRKTARRRVSMAKRKRTYRRRSNPMTSYSKSNVALGTLLGTVAPKFVPGATSWLPLVGLLPKSPTAVKVMSWMIASKVVSDRFVGK